MSGCSEIEVGRHTRHENCGPRVSAPDDEAPKARLLSIATSKARIETMRKRRYQCAIRSPLRIARPWYHGAPRLRSADDALKGPCDFIGVGSSERCASAHKNLCCFRTSVAGPRGRATFPSSTMSRHDARCAAKD